MSQRAGWYDDPENPENLRYFDGVVWTSHTTPRTSPTASQSTIGAAQPVPVRPPDPSSWTPPQDQQQDQQRPGSQDDPQGGQAGSPNPYGQPPVQPPYGQPPHYGQPQNSAAQSYGGGFGIKTTPDGAPLAGYGQRVGAYILDRIIVLVITLVAASYWVVGFLQWYVGWIESIMSDSQDGRVPVLNQATLTAEVTSRVLPITLVGVAVGVLYSVFFLTRKGATPGMMVLGIQVRLRERPGHISVLDALKREAIQIVVGLTNLVPVVSLIASLLGLLNVLWPLWDDKRQALHDKVARTNVVVKPRGR